MIDDIVEKKAYAGKRQEAQKMMKKCRKLHLGNMLTEELK